MTTISSSFVYNEICKIHEEIMMAMGFIKLKEVKKEWTQKKKSK